MRTDFRLRNGHQSLAASRFYFASALTRSKVHRTFAELRILVHCTILASRADTENCSIWKAHNAYSPNVIGYVKRLLSMTENNNLKD